MSRVKTNTAVIGAGSNINPKDNIKLAMEKVSLKLKILNSSKFIFTKPIGYENQDDFLNGAFLIETEHDETGIDKILKDIEIKLGRKKTTIKNRPRTIDLDILVWNDRVVDPNVYSRNFLRDSILELIPNFKF